MIAYAVDVVIVSVGKDLMTISDIKESALKELTRWAKDNGLGMNSKKTELILFTRR